MNLNLIRKYEKEFLHMLHGGKVIMGKKDSITCTVKWYPSVLNPFVETSDTIVIVIDDVYCTYRKALAEGKTVQYKGLSTHSWCTIQQELGHTFGSIHVSNYRIKPEEPEFKIGDWVIVNGPDGTFIECISGIADNTYTLSGTNICYKSQASKWNPTRGEVCIFWDDNILSSPSIIKFDYINDSGQYGATDNTFWDNCMPFEGKLPPHMKDNK